MNTDTYRTITESATGAYKEKGSKFLAFAYPIASSNEVKPIIDSLKTEYYDARHHCFAYRIGQSGDQWRAVDDGEPAGTAGRPILGQLQSAELTNLLVVVVRYFGGTKLGVPGLINAYKEATIDVLRNSSIIERTVDVEFSLIFGYVSMNEVMRVIKEFGPAVAEQDFDNVCSMRLSLRCANADMFYEKTSKIEGVNIEKL